MKRKKGLKRTRFKRSNKKTPKKIAWEWASRHVRLLGVIETCKKYNFLSPRDAIAECYTCGRLVNITKRKYGGQAGHFRSRKMGGSSGIYFDMRGLRVQCEPCNGFNQGMPDEFEEHLIREFDELFEKGESELNGKETVEDLKLKDKINSYTEKEILGQQLYHEQETWRLLKETGIEQWWK